jgi:dTDP-4-amino-4,6-dideoxygalactose transaminase
VKVPFLDLKAQYAAMKDEIDAAVHAVMDNTAFAGGRFVAEFEEAFAAFCGVPHAVGVGSGTEALWFALLAMGIGPGDEVITVPNTFIATAEAITFCGATPVFVDIDPRYYTMDPGRLEAAITSRTKAVIPVHLYGQTADMDPILDIARRHRVRVIEDACQAHGATYKGRRAGTMGDAGCFSFYPGKNLGAFGEAGAIVTHDDDLDAHIRMLRDHGQARKYHHAHIGWNGRMDGIQGAVLNVKLRHLASENEQRRVHAEHYRILLASIDGVAAPEEAPYARHVYHIYAVRVAGRDAVLAAMAQRNIACGIHYPGALHLEEAYRPLGFCAGSFPVAERCAAEELSLPMFAYLSGEEVEYTASVLGELVAS